VQSLDDPFLVKTWQLFTLMTAKNDARPKPGRHQGVYTFYPDPSQLPVFQEVKEKLMHDGNRAVAAAARRV
jgi:hypothetical protein